MYKFKRDTYSRNRDGTSHVLDVACKHCGQHTAYYQKDGPGALLRMYVDRFIDVLPSGEQLVCSSCGHALGMRTIFQKEHRPAYRLYAGAVTKKITDPRNV